MPRDKQTILTEIRNLVNSDATLKNLVTVTNPTPITQSNKNLSWFQIQTDESDYSSLTKSVKNLHFLIVKVYTPAQSSAINAAIKSGAAIYFSKKGNIKIGGSTIINNASAAVEGNTMTHSNDSHGANDFLDIVPSHFQNDLYGYSERTVFNPDLTYILQQTNSGYVLLYNPVHRSNFKKFYKLLYEYGHIDDYGYGGTDTIKIGNYDFNLEGFIRSYCNSFVVESRKRGKAMGAKNSKVSMYADPFCAIMINSKQSMLNAYFASNVTEQAYWKDYWPKTEMRDDLVKMVEQLTLRNPTSWACHKTDNPSSSYNFINKIPDTESFIKYLAKININGYESSSARISDLDTANPACTKPTVIQCTIAAVSAGDIQDANLSCPEGVPNTMTGIIGPIADKYKTPGNKTPGTTPPGKTPPKSNKDVYDDDDYDDDDEGGWKPMYTYILIGLALLLVAVLMYVLLFKTSSVSAPSAKIETPAMNFF